jgi:proteasome accessory factor B
VATAKAERLLNLVIALVNSPRYRSAAWIREKVAGYADAPTSEAFFRTFERDKQELRELGIPVQTPPDGTDGYRIPPIEFALPELSFTPAEAAALALAGRLWETTALARAGSGALRKIRDAQDPSGGERGTRLANRRAESGAVMLLQPRVRTSDPAFAPLLAAVRARRAVTFDYRKDSREAPEPRALQPWGLVSYHGRWYVVGFDQARQDRRTFRVSRIVGPVRAVGPAGAVSPPDGVDLLAEVAASVQPVVDRTATLRVRAGHAAGLRRSALTSVPDDDAPEWDRVTIPLGSLWDMARRITGNGADVVVDDPPDLRDAVVRLLTGSAKAARPHATSTGERLAAEDEGLPLREIVGESG